MAGTATPARRKPVKPPSNTLSTPEHSSRQKAQARLESAARRLAQIQPARQTPSPRAQALEWRREADRFGELMGAALAVDDVFDEVELDRLIEIAERLTASNNGGQCGLESV